MHNIAKMCPCLQFVACILLKVIYSGLLQEACVPKIPMQHLQRAACHANDNFPGPLPTMITPACYRRRGLLPKIFKHLREAGSLETPDIPPFDRFRPPQERRPTLHNILASMERCSYAKGLTHAESIKYHLTWQVRSEA